MRRRAWRSPAANLNEKLRKATWSMIWRYFGKLSRFSEEN
jgi:hypothetical protein